MPPTASAASRALLRRPSSGGYGPSQTDWGKVANPEAFEAYRETQPEAIVHPKASGASAEETQPVFRDPGAASGGEWTPGRGPQPGGDMGFGNTDPVSGGGTISDSERKVIQSRAMLRYGHGGYGGTGAWS